MKSLEFQEVDPIRLTEEEFESLADEVEAFVDRKSVV